MIIKSAGFIDSSMTPAQAPLNFAYALFLKLRSEDYPAADVERYVRRWFALSILTGRYSGQMETRFEQDIQAGAKKGFGEYLAAMEAAELSEVFWNVGLVQALNTSNGNHPAFLAFLAAQVKESSRGFLSKAISVRSMLEHRGGVHHIYPKEYLKKSLGLKRADYNQIANYVYTQQEINIAIGDDPPHEYMAAVVEQCETKHPVYGGITELDDLRDNLRQSAVPEALLQDDPIPYEDFLRERRKLMAARLQSYYASL